MVTRRWRTMAEQALWLEKAGRTEEAGRLRVELEKSNRCLMCGGSQVFHEEYYRRSGLWACGSCDSYLWNDQREG